MLFLLKAEFFSKVFHSFWDDRSLIINLLTALVTAFRTDVPDYSGPQSGSAPSIAVAACVLLFLTCILLLVQVINSIIISNNESEMINAILYHARSSLQFITFNVQDLI